MINKFILIVIILITSAISTPSFAKEVNCEATVRNGIAILKARLEKQNPGKPSAFLTTMNSPQKIESGIRKCEEEIKTNKGLNEWACQETAKTFEELSACEK